MPTIVMSSTKGGVGKSTIALILAQVFAEAGSSVTLIDADPNQPLATWATLFKDAVPSEIEVVGSVNENNILETIEAAAARSAFVIVDVEGSANVALTYALSSADLVLVPVQGKQLDANQAGRVVKLIERQSAILRRDIAYRIVFSRMSSLRPKEEAHVRDDLAARGMPMLDVQMIDRAAFSAIFQLGGSIYDLTPADVSGATRAIANAEALARSVATELHALMNDRKAA